MGSVQTEMFDEAFPGYKAPVDAKEMAEFISDFALTGHKFFNGKILPVAVRIRKMPRHGMNPVESPMETLSDVCFYLYLPIQCQQSIKSKSFQFILTGIDNYFSNKINH